MTAQSVSLISTLINLLLGIGKIVIGVIIKSTALIADGIHSGLDVLSSFITFLGIKISQKPQDELHHYGYLKAESLAGFVVTIILALSGVWILYEAVESFLKKENIHLSLPAIAFVIVSIIACELSARMKFFYGRKHQSLSLVADAEHSRADALSSVGVLLSLLISPYIRVADAIVALLIGIYILHESVEIGREITESLLDVANKDVENRIKKICSSHKIEIESLKTRRIGAFNFAEIKLRLPSRLKLEKVEQIIQTLEERLLNNIPELKQVVISARSYETSRSVVLPKFGKKIGDLKTFEKIGPAKKGLRTIIPLQNEKTPSPDFGAPYYLLIDKKNSQPDKVVFHFLKNPYFEKDSPHGARFAKAVRADIVKTIQIGENARQSLENFGIQIKLTNESELKDILKQWQQTNFQQQKDSDKSR